MDKFKDEQTNSQISLLRLQAEERVMQSRAPKYGIEYIDLRGYTINPEAVALIPEAIARQHSFVAFDKKNRQISVALTQPENDTVRQYLSTLEAQGFTYQLFLCSDASITHAHKRYGDIKTTIATKKGVLDINPEVILTFSKSIKTIQDIANQLTQVRTINSPRRVSETLEMMFAGALALKASDIHIEPEEFDVRLRYRLDGVLIDIFKFETFVYGRIISRLKLLSGMILNQRHEAQDGRFRFTFGEREIEVRSSIIPGAGGESMVMRLLDPGVASFSIDKLQLNPQLAAVMEEQLKRPNGLIITTGPTGSGKTTALYAFLRAVHDSEKKIITIENPVEYKLEGIVQTQTGTDYSFSQGLRAILRQDPDIIMVGEIRDREVAETAIHAAQTGHLVFSTLHTNNAVGGFPRLMDLGVDPRILGSAINIILGQRLVRVLCDECKEQYEASEKEKGLIELLTADYPGGMTVPNPLMLYKSKGCPACGNTGYKGRVGVFEAIAITDAVEEAVIRDPREFTILEAAKEQNIPSMAQDGIVKVLNGTTDIIELQRVVDLSGIKHGKTIPTDNGTDAEVKENIDDDFLEHIV
ncbi:MAG: GspE/PulE family protein [Candidatus Paceibacteria bacterium]